MIFQTGGHCVCIPRRCEENDLLSGHLYRLIEDDWQLFEFQRGNVEHEPVVEELLQKERGITTCSESEVHKSDS